MYYFAEYYKQKTGRAYRGVFGYAVCFPYFKIKNGLDMQTPPEIILDAANMENLPAAIDRLFDYYQNSMNCKSSADEEELFHEMIAIRRNFAILKGSLIKSQEERFAEVNQIQDALLDFIQNYSKVLITGGAGTGKTIIAVKKAKRVAVAGKTVLFLCYNRRLAQYLADCSFSAHPNIKYINYHAFVEEVVGSETFKILFELTKGSMETVCSEISSLNTNKYDTVIVDEAQDFFLEWVDSLEYFLKPAGELFLFYDESQSIFEDNIKAIAAKFAYPAFHLNRNLRNSAQIQQWAVKETGLGADVLTNSIEGVTPQKISCDNSAAAIKQLTKTVNQLIVEEKIQLQQIVIVSDRKLANSILKETPKIGTFKITEDFSATNDLRFVTIQSFKGMEADVVIFLEHGQSRKKLSYVTYTRARFMLIVIQCGEVKTNV